MGLTDALGIRMLPSLFLLTPVRFMEVSPPLATELIRRRRSVKPPRMSDRPIDDATLRSLLENATWAPTHGHTEPWRFKVYRGDARGRLGDVLAEYYERLTPPERFQPAKVAKLQKLARMVPAVIVICMARDPREKIPEWEEIAAVACAVHNLHLSAVSHGLSGYWSSPAFMTGPEFASYLGLGEKDRCLGLFYLGYPAGDWGSSVRKPIDEVVEFIDA